MRGSSIKSSERTLAVFELFSVHQQPLRVKDVADTLDIPQPSASVLLNNLVELGYLEKNHRTRTFSPTIRVLLLGSWLSHRFGETTELTRQLRELRQAIKEAIFIGVQNGAVAQYVLIQGVGHPDRMNVESGLFNSLTCSATGQALLALKPDDEVLAWVRRCNAEAEDDRFKVSGPAFMERIAEVRRKGYAETDGGVADGISGIAIATRLPISEAPLAVGCGMRTESKDAKRDLVISALLNLKNELDSKYGKPPERTARDASGHADAKTWKQAEFFNSKSQPHRSLEIILKSPNEGGGEGEALKS